MAVEKKNMYVGHRYVPKIFGEWNQTETYEGLSIVTALGSSYTSKKRVPVGVPITNGEYWVLTGNYNAQIEGYRQETQRVSDEVKVTDLKVQARMPRRSIAEVGCVPRTINAEFDNAPLINELAATLVAGQTLYVPENFDCTIKNSVIIPSGVNVVMESRFIYSGEHDRPAIVYGSTSKRSRPNTLRFSVSSELQSDWLNPSYIGLFIYNVEDCIDFTIDNVNGFTTGVKFSGSGSGFVYNKIDIGVLLNNKTALIGTNQNNGWFNENTIYITSIMLYSTINTGKSRYGVLITSEDGIYKNNNNNVFYGSYELKEDQAKLSNPLGESIPVVIEHGKYNKFLNSRDESNGATFARTMNDSLSNIFDVSWSSTSSLLQDLSLTSENKISSQRELMIFNNEPTPIFSTGFLPHKIITQRPDFQMVDGLHSTMSSSATPSATIYKAVSTPDHIVLTNKGLGRFVDTTTSKKFIVKASTVIGYKGRVAVRCYDNEGNILNGGVGTYLRNGVLSSMSWFGNEYGGVYKTNNDKTGAIYFEVSEEVKKIDVMLIGGTIPCHLQSFIIYTLGINIPKTWIDFNGLSNLSTSIEVTPTFLGQFCVVGGIGYIATGVTAPTDWKQITV